MKQVILLVLMYISLSSCYAPKKIYSAPTVNLLHLEKQGDIKLAANYSTVASISFANKNQRSQGADVQAAYAINEKVAITISGYLKNENNQSIASISTGVPYESVNYNKRGCEIGAGFYHFKNKTGRQSFNVFAGFGLGKLSFEGAYEDSYSKYAYFHRTAYKDVFIQPSYSVYFSRNNLFTLGTKFFLLKYYNVKTDHPDIQTLNFRNIDKEKSFFTSFMLQDEFGFKGLNNIKFQCQAGASILLTTFKYEVYGNSYRDNYDYNGLWFALGVVADLRKLISSKN